jgi:hypothetical protein
MFCIRRAAAAAAAPTAAPAATAAALAAPAATAAVAAAAAGRRESLSPGRAAAAHTLGDVRRRHPSHGTPIRRASGGHAAAAARPDGRRR